MFVFSATRSLWRARIRDKAIAHRLEPIEHIENYGLNVGLDGVPDVGAVSDSEVSGNELSSKVKNPVQSNITAIPPTATLVVELANVLLTGYLNKIIGRISR
jgi:hypothetical protein